MVCLKLRGRKWRRKWCPTTVVQQCLPDLSKVDQKDPANPSSVVKTEITTVTEKSIKFLCSYGGKILPYPSDGKLNYVGGETRAVYMPRSMSFSDLNKKIEDLFKVGKIIIKYRIMSEDLNTLVSIRCNDDLPHLWEEYDWLMSLGSSSSSPPRFFRLYIFRVPNSLSLSRHRHYLDAINGQLMDPTSNFNVEALRDHHDAESLAFCHVGDPTGQRAELSGSNCVALSQRPNQFHRVRSTPNLCEAHQAGGDGPGPSIRAQSGHIHQNHTQFMGHLHQQACGRSDTCRSGNISVYSVPKFERPPVRVHSYQNLNLLCQTSPIVGERNRLNLVQSSRTIDNVVQNVIPNNLIHCNSLQPISNGIGGHKQMYSGHFVQNQTPHSSNEQNLIQSYAGAFGSLGSRGSMHVPMEMRPCIYVQQPRSGSLTPVGRQSRASTPVSEA